MEKSVSKTLSISQHEQNNNQLIDLILLDEVTNIQYVLKVEKKVYNRAHNDIMFATTLLKKAQTLHNSKDTIHSSASSIKNSKSSCSNVTSTIVPDNTDNTENIVHKYTSSSTENISDTLNTEVNIEKWEHKAVLLLISLYKEKSYMLGKGSHKKMWIDISKCMKEKKYNFTGNQCNNKMDALKRRYRQIVDHNAQSGNDRKDWIYLDVLDNIFRKKHWIKPLSVAGSNIKEPEHSPLTDNSDENETPVKQRKISLTEARANYLTLSLEEKRLKRKETANYRATKLQILREIKEALGKQKQ
ncbi:uncharacterized protein [Linepithema humile]|uniref:uncharacterized protein n=1 Tax=Linepithema humile TaxID=83485 RepID=UPI00351EAEF7